MRKGDGLTYMHEKGGWADMHVKGGGADQTLGSWTNAPDLLLGGNSPVVTYLRHSMMVCITTYTMTWFISCPTQVTRDNAQFYQLHSAQL